MNLTDEIMMVLSIATIDSELAKIVGHWLYGLNWNSRKEREYGYLNTNLGM
jgi:hypothetical protein